MQYCPKPWLDAPVKPFLGTLQPVASLPAGASAEQFYYGDRLHRITDSGLVAVERTSRANHHDLIIVDEVTGKCWRLVLPA